MILQKEEERRKESDRDMWEQKGRDGGQFPRFKATIQNIRAQIVQFSDRKRWVIVLLVFFKPYRHPTIATVTHVGKLIPPPETH